MYPLQVCVTDYLLTITVMTFKWFNLNDYCLQEFITGEDLFSPMMRRYKTVIFTYMWTQFILLHCTNQSQDTGVYSLTIFNLIKTCL